MTQIVNGQSAGRIILRNTIFGVGAQMALRLVSFLFQVLVIRQLGDAQYGQYNIVLAWAGLFAVLGDLGITQYYRREIARDRSTTGKFFWDMVTLRLLLAVLTTIVTVGGAVLFLRPLDDQKIIAIVLFTSTYFFQAFLVPMTSVLEGNERIDVVSILVVIGQVIFLTAGGLFLWAGKNYVWLVIAALLNIPVLIALSYRFVRRNNLGPPRFNLNPDLWWGIIKYGIPFGLIQLTLTISLSADRIFLTQFGFSAQEIGWYSIAYNLTLNFISVASAFNSAFQPTLAREHTNNPAAAPRWYFRSVKMILFLGLPLAVGGMLLAEPLISTIYKPENRAAFIAFMIIIWDLPLRLYNDFCGNMTTSIVRERGAARINASQAITNVVTNFILVPYFGMIATAFTTVLTDLVGTVQFYVLFRREFGFGLGFKYLARIVLSAGIMGILIVVMSRLGLHLFLILPLAGLSYLVLVWATGVFTAEERAIFSGLARKVTGRLRPNANS